MANSLQSLPNASRLGFRHQFSGFDSALEPAFGSVSFPSQLLAPSLKYALLPFTFILSDFELRLIISVFLFGWALE